MEIEVLKCHGSGNEFLLIDEISNFYSFTETHRADLAKALCNRNTEFGADGILFVLKSDKADARMRIFNADGSEASMCGNGLRCVARYICDLTGKENAMIETMKVTLRVEKEEDIFPGIPTYKVEVSPVSFRLADLPLVLPEEKCIDGKIPSLSKELPFTALAVPNPHLVAIVDDKYLETSLQLQISEYVNRPNPLFPDGVNVSFVKLLEKGYIYVRTFERGVGFTNACGTAMSASSLVTCLLGFNEKEKLIEVYNDGGKVHCVVHEKAGQYMIDLIGNGTYIYKTVVRVADQDFNQVSIKNKTVFSDEERRYSKLQEHARSFILQHK